MCEFEYSNLFKFFKLNLKFTYHLVCYITIIFFFFSKKKNNNNITYRNTLAYKKNIKK
jgi:hypothetical protein